MHLEQGVGQVTNFLLIVCWRSITAYKGPHSEKKKETKFYLQSSYT